MPIVTFPLYENLIKELDSEELTIKDQDKFMKLIKTFDTVGFELIYILILCFQLENCDNSNSIILPYSGKFINNDITFDFNEFPHNLKKILYKFAKIHTKKMKEEILLKENIVSISSS